MKAADWIDRVRAQKEWSSDYRVAKELGFRASTISQYRSHGGTLDESIASRLPPHWTSNPKSFCWTRPSSGPKTMRQKAPYRAPSSALRRCRLCASCYYFGSTSASTGKR